jgi:dTDP-4-amino-4,6-dideoxygalactose transaminase
VQPIHHTFGPHVTKQFAGQAFKLLWQPWKFKHGEAGQQVRKKLEAHFGGTASLFISGRDGLRTLLKTECSEGDEVIIQGFTCIAVTNAVVAAGCKPFYADCSRETLCMTAESIKNVITPTTKFVVFQCTFGSYQGLKQVYQLCQQHNCTLIADIAHVIPDANTANNREYLETIKKNADYIMLSFGRDKAISSVTGGAIINLKDGKKFDKNLPMPSFFSIKRWLLYPLFYVIAKPWYHLGIGKAIMQFAAKTNMLAKVYSSKERVGNMGKTVYGFPNALAELWLTQWKQLAAINAHRFRLTENYLAALATSKATIGNEFLEPGSYNRLPLYITDASGVRDELKQQQIYLNDGWCDAVVCPVSISKQYTHYKEGSCPEAEWIANHILSLPCHPTMTPAQQTTLLTTLQPHLT